MFINLNLIDGIILGQKAIDLLLANGKLILINFMFSRSLLNSNFGIMKKLFIFIAFAIPSVCFGQFDGKVLIGEWVYTNAVYLDDSPADSLVQGFSLVINEDSSFELTAKEYFIAGSWDFQDSVLKLDGERSDKVTPETTTLKVHKLTDSAVSFIMDSETGGEFLMNLSRK